MREFAKSSLREGGGVAEGRAAAEGNAEGNTRSPANNQCSFLLFLQVVGEEDVVDSRIDIPATRRLRRQVPG